MPQVCDTDIEGASRDLCVWQYTEVRNEYSGVG